MSPVLVKSSLISYSKRRPIGRVKWGKAVRKYVFFLMFLAIAAPAHAYVGPGSGLTFVATLLALVAAVVTGIAGFIWYPIKRILRGVRGRRRND